MTAATASLAGTWSGDPIHSDIGFKVRHMGVGKVRGSFALTSATLTVGEDGGLAGASVTAEIDATSVDTKQDQRDAHVRSDDFLNVEAFPTISFASTGVSGVDGDDFVLAGDLTIRDKTLPVELAVEFGGVLTDAYGHERTAFSATTTFSRKDFGVSFNAVFGASNAVVSDKVDVTLDLEFTKNPA